MKDLIIIGASGFGREVAWLVERINAKLPTWNILGFLDSDPEKQGQMINRYPVLGKDEKVQEYPAAYVVCAIASARIREKIIRNIQQLMPDIKFAILIDPSVEMSEWISVGEGTIICAHTIATVNIGIGSHVIINLDCTVGHDAIISDFVTVYPSVNISGNTVIGHCCEIGTGTQIIQGKRIGDYSIVGAGAVVVKDIPPKCTAVGSPAKVIKYLE
ncbi:MAG: acetyltransferase [Oscillospiraceae bacterium]|nr:acetyltransferase [Oscillospiraceae bacterium]